MPKEKVADYFVAYAEKIGAPVRCGVEVRKVARLVGRPDSGSRPPRADRGAESSSPPPERSSARSSPRRSRDAGTDPDAFRRLPQPRPAPEGAVLVVGAGSSGVQIARSSSAPAGASISRSARTTARRAPTAGVTTAGGSACSASGTSRRRRRAPNTSPSRSAARWRPDDRLPAPRRCRHDAGRPDGGYKDGAMTFAGDLAENLARGDANYLSVLDEADA